MTPALSPRDPGGEGATLQGPCRSRARSSSTSETRLPPPADRGLRLDRPLEPGRRPQRLLPRRAGAAARLDPPRRVRPGLHAEPGAARARTSATSRSSSATGSPASRAACGGCSRSCCRARSSSWARARSTRRAPSGAAPVSCMRGLSAAVVGLVLVTSLRIMRGSLRGGRAVVIALITFVAVGPLRLPTVGVVLLMTALSLGLHWSAPAARPVLAGSPVHPATGGRVMADLALLTWTFLWLSFLCVGGGLGVIPEMERQAVTIHHWLTAREFVDGYTLSQLTPGPGMLVAVFVGHRAHGLLGAALAGLAMFVPTSVLAIVISHHWQQWRARPWARRRRAGAPAGRGRADGGRGLHARAHRDPRRRDRRPRGGHRARGGHGSRAAGGGGAGRGHGSAGSSRDRRAGDA